MPTTTTTTTTTTKLETKDYYKAYLQHLTTSIKELEAYASKMSSLAPYTSREIQELQIEIQRVQTQLSYLPSRSANPNYNSRPSFATLTPKAKAQLAKQYLLLLDFSGYCAEHALERKLKRIVRQLHLERVWESSNDEFPLLKVHRYCHKLIHSART